MHRMSGRALKIAECRLNADLLTLYVVLPCSMTVPDESTFKRLDAKKNLNWIFKKFKSVMKKLIEKFCKNLEAVCRLNWSKSKRGRKPKAIY
ncbi:hypothetical protein BpHYR1_039403 [Brachionus plicatilis]|uniref:Uncharacterized protein n=1 Tax=Brachionus plicatilis TaxID=10195 RepID=A0A3M7SUP9_BRAPC|nr:hypothetical protein BpHYR1_039403 [Brachionus plicatilis]